MKRIHAPIMIFVLAAAPLSPVIATTGSSLNIGASRANTMLDSSGARANRGFPDPAPTGGFILVAGIVGDADSDGVADASDNCTLLPNPNQLDADGDGYGNICDADLNNSGTVTATDFNLLRGCINLSASSSPTCAAADIDGSGTVTEEDFNLLSARVNTPPGPSGLHPP